MLCSECVCVRMSCGWRSIAACLSAVSVSPCWQVYFKSCCCESSPSTVTTAFKPQREKNNPPCPSRLLLPDTHLTQFYYCPPNSILSSYSYHVWAVLHVHSVQIVLDIKPECNLSDHRTSGDQVLWGIKLCHSFRFREFRSPDTAVDREEKIWSRTRRHYPAPLSTSQNINFGCVFILLCI